MKTKPQRKTAAITLTLGKDVIDALNDAARHKGSSASQVVREWAIGAFKLQTSSEGEQCPSPTVRVPVRSKKVAPCIVRA